MDQSPGPPDRYLPAPGSVQWQSAVVDDAPAAGDDRDRDPSGRARQGRPRDGLGRPLAYGSRGVEPVPELALGPEQTLAAARDLVSQGRPFSAHEVLEARWKDCPALERDLWQGLAQICVGLTHAGRGNLTGAARLVERGASRLHAYADSPGPTYGLDLVAVEACARARVPGADPSGRGG